MSKKIRILLLAWLSILFAGCVSQGEDKKEINNEPGALDVIICEEPRPKICTREYNPVCGTMQNGTSATHATGCTSCSNPDVVGYKMGAC